MNVLNAGLKGLIKMANVIITLQIMPEGVETDLKAVEEGAKKHIAEFAGEGDMRVTKKPVAFGLKALEIIFVMDENLGSTEELENKVKEVEGVSSVEVTDVRRAVG